jgi:hypothetical protein
MEGIQFQMLEDTGKDPTVSAVILGTNKIGKTTFLAEAPKVVFLDLENSTREIKGAVRFPVPDPGKPWTWERVNSNMDWLLTADHDRQSLAIDVVDELEKVIHAELIRRKPTVVDRKTVIEIKTIEDYPYSGGYKMTVDIWRELALKLERLRRERKMNILMASHAAIRMVENAAGENYEQWDMSVHKYLAGEIRGWVDAILFAEYRLVVKRKSNFDKGKGLDNAGARVIHTEERPAFRAGNRYSLPFELDLSWDAFYSHARGTGAETADVVSARIRERFAESELATKAESGIKKIGNDLRKLRGFENYLATQLKAKEAEE